MEEVEEGGPPEECAVRGPLALLAALGGEDVGELGGAEVAHHLELLQLVIGPGEVKMQ